MNQEGEFKTLRIDPSNMSDRLAMFEKICELRALNIAEMKAKFNVSKGKVSVVHLSELCVFQKQTFQYYGPENMLAVIVEVVHAVGAKVIDDPSILQETEVDHVEVKEKDTILENDEELF